MGIETHKTLNFCWWLEDSWQLRSDLWMTYCRLARTKLLGKMKLQDY